MNRDSTLQFVGSMLDFREAININIAWKTNNSEGQSERTVWELFVKNEDMLSAVNAHYNNHLWHPIV